jgi:alpha-glucosidase
MSSLRGITAALLLAGASRSADVLTLSSPGGNVQCKIGSDGGRLTYAISRKSHPVIEASPLGIVVDRVNLGDGAKAGAVSRYKVDETYDWYGNKSHVVNRASGARIALNSAGTSFTLEVRAYDDGVAFRFIVPGAAVKSRVPDEATAFRLPAGSTVWYHDFEGHYEGEHVKKPLADVPADQWVAPPLTFRLPDGGYGSITEGALFHYAGMGLQADGNGGFLARLGHAQPPSYPFRLRYGADEAKRLSEPAAIDGTITTPWRAVMAGSDLNALVNSDIVHNVAPPPDPKYFPQGLKTPWLKPGRAVWKYLDGGGENNLETMKEFSRLAGELGFEYNVVEGFWSRWSPEELKGFVEYSKERGVGVVLWKHSRDLRTNENRRAFFDRIADAGAAGAKIDFFDHEAKEVIELYETLLRDAAERHLILDFHGANKPTGESRTWPNEMTREGIRGMESRKTLRAGHDTTLPFTRMLAGHADYTPVHFGDRRNNTSWAHQIASAAVLTSPLLVYGASPRSMLDNPAVEMIKNIPSVWDETIALPPCEIGELVAFARRRGNAWFLAVMSGPSAHTIDVPLAFLSAGKYQALEVGDVPENTGAVDVRKRSLTRGDSIHLALQPGGGYIARFKP